MADLRCLFCRQTVRSEGALFHERGDCGAPATTLDEHDVKEGPERDLYWAGLMLAREVNHSTRTALHIAALRYAASLGWTSPWYSPPDHLSIVREYRETPYVLKPLAEVAEKLGFLTDFYPPPSFNAYRVDMRPYILKWRDRDIFASRDALML